MTWTGGPIRTESQPYYDREITTFSASAAFYFYRHIPDPSKVTVGERDDRVLAVAEEIKSWLLEQSNEQLTAKDRDQRFQAAFDRICRSTATERSPSMQMPSGWTPV